jgi:WhiB family transcriptional regulator, redox-sensing transcriptional regulator
VLFSKQAEVELESLAKAIRNAPVRIPCMESDPELFFDRDNYRQARKLCSRCPVKSECLTVALANDEQFGVWGGLSPNERKGLKRKK